jgi:hypothetical protein
MRDLAEYGQLVAQLQIFRKVTHPNEDLDSVRVDGLAKLLAGASWRRHVYSFFIVQLYGAHERFVRDLAEQVAQLYVHVYRNYEALPETVRKAHLIWTVKHLQDLVDRKEFDKVTFLQSIGQLDECLRGVIKLNDRAMSRSTANFRPDVVRSVLGRLSITLPDVENDDEMRGLLSGVLDGVYSSVDAVVDDLADRRNEIAHGLDFEILDLETVLALANVVYAYDCWLLRSAVQVVLDGLVERESVQLGTVENVWSNRDTGVKTVVNLLDVAEPVSTGGPAYIRTKVLIPCRIVSIEHKNERISEALPGCGPFGIDVGIPVHAKNRVLQVRHQWLRVEQALLRGITIRPDFHFRT